LDTSVSATENAENLGKNPIISYLFIAVVIIYSLLKMAAKKGECRKRKWSKSGSLSLLSMLLSIIWLLLVLGACSFFIWFMTDRVLYLASHPKAVDVEVIYTDSVVFPAVTICNQNLFRLV